MTLTTTEAQVGSKIDLENVDVQTKALPTIFLFGKEYYLSLQDLQYVQEHEPW